ncbi:PAP2-domain-containing protein [Basidiobolus meristosporus CBS 931.73]|uniref:PAP2-domain-containing protein n=1 Tax=Basidiobolus meristosporus CBS 931.73 TaxID=1314790 RepID=A0A1Y1XSV1_9FUNG|nr:PAP2-domain-containing protein [Basidiobolus meristosporus CBS 931.73]|eukprot:ORX88832.1 PAP2-domain-containing protein [Basidiobolus meristosporus CBS 931.73]
MVSKKDKFDIGEADFDVSRIVFPEHLYENLLSPRRSRVRKRFLEFVHSESLLLARIQTFLRHPFLDQYFISSAVLGNHVTFLLILPHLFMFGIPVLAREMVNLLLYGVVVTCIAKDYLCLPRPPSPPVHRLSINKSHHLEYGFPSTHTSCCVGVGLSCLSYIYKSEALGTHTKLFLGLASFFYMFSVSFGRIYCGMHSITDVLGGAFFGILLWAIFHVGQPVVEATILYPSVFALIGLISALVLIIHVQPDPLNACPCFEDSVASLGAIIGAYLGSWQGTNGSSFWTEPIQATLQYSFARVGLTRSVMRVLVSFVMIIVWRLMSKRLCHLTLPRVYKLLGLPAKRLHKPSKKYQTLNHTPISMIPSVINLDTGTDPKLKVKRGALGLNQEQAPRTREDHVCQFERELVDFRNEVYSILPRYDLETLTKLVVYTGIGWWATLGSPMLCYYFGI